MTEPELVGVIDELRLRLFRFAVLGGLMLVAVAVMLSIIAPEARAAGVLGAGALMTAPLVFAARHQHAAWRLVCRWPAWTLLVGPLNAVVGLLADRSAFLYPSLAWIAVAAIAGGLRWSLAAAVVLTIATTIAALVDAGSLQAALLELPRGLLSRLFFAIAMASLGNGLAQIVWIRALAASPRSAVAAGGTSRSPRRPVDVAKETAPREAVEIDGGKPDDATTTPTMQAAYEEAGFGALTVREKEVIALLAAGLSLARAAHALGISYRAARARTDRARNRVGARTTPELVRWAVDNGYVPQPGRIAAEPS